MLSSYFVIQNANYKRRLLLTECNLQGVYKVYYRDAEYERLGIRTAKMKMMLYKFLNVAYECKAMALAKTADERDSGK
jgi:hypothetical protein